MGGVYCLAPIASELPAAFLLYRLFLCLIGFNIERFLMKGPPLSSYRLVVCPIGSIMICNLISIQQLSLENQMEQTETYHDKIDNLSAVKIRENINRLTEVLLQIRS